MKSAEEILHGLSLESTISLEDIPQIDLYMDQVIQLFETKFGPAKRSEQDKILTKTMINNYAKGKLFIPIKNKKYSKEHLILISLIYQMKSGLSLQDIKATLEGMNKKVEDNQFHLEAFYNSYLNLFQKNINSFKNELAEKIEAAQLEVNEFDDSDYTMQVLLISSLINMSYLYRRAAEKLVDEITAEKRGERKK